MDRYTMAGKSLKQLLADVDSGRLAQAVAALAFEDSRPSLPPERRLGSLRRRRVRCGRG
jgi:hypothetical protein